MAWLWRIRDAGLDFEARKNSLEQSMLHDIGEGTQSAPLDSRSRVSRSSQAKIVRPVTDSLELKPFFFFIELHNIS